LPWQNSLANAEDHYGFPSSYGSIYTWDVENHMVDPFDLLVSFEARTVGVSALPLGRDRAL